MVDSIINLFKNDTISKLSLIISLLTFLYTYEVNKFNLKVKIVPSNTIACNKNDDYQYSYFIKCDIINKSKIPITILSVTLNEYQVFRFKVIVCGNSVVKNNKLFNDVVSSFNYPLKLDSYDAKKGAFLFCSDNEFKFKRYNLLTINTSRGKYYRIIKNPLRK